MELMSIQSRLVAKAQELSSLTEAVLAPGPLWAKELGSQEWLRKVESFQLVDHMQNTWSQMIINAFL